jgi:hypothetical protein
MIVEDVLLRRTAIDSRITTLVAVSGDLNLSDAIDLLL